MRILLFLSDFDGGGAQRTFVNLANGMFDKSIDIKLVVGRSGTCSKMVVRKNSIY